MWRATLKGLAAKKLRLLLTALAIVLGVGFMSGTYVLTDTINASFDQLFTTAIENLDVVAQGTQAFAPSQAGPGGGASDERRLVPVRLERRIERLPGVRVAEGYAQGYAQFVNPKDGLAITTGGAPTIGVSYTPVTTGLTLRDGGFPASKNEVGVDAVTARKYGLKIGEKVDVLFVDGQDAFRIAGIVGFGEVDNLAGATLAVFDVHTAQIRLLDARERFSQINVQAQEGVSANALAERIGDLLPKGYEAVTAASLADESAEQLKDSLGFFRTALLVFAFVALFVGAFIIFNTFTIIVAQRTRELALLRVLGASRRQVLTSVLAEAIFVGLVASGLGVLAGLAIAIGLQSVLRIAGIELPSTATQLLPRTVVVSLVVGAAITLVSAIAPARRAARVAPMQALQDPEQNPIRGSLRRRAIAGAVVTALGLCLVLAGLFAETDNGGAAVGLGAAVTFLGVAVISPLVARPLSGALGAPLAALGMAGKLGRENAKRNPRRTASTAAALMIGLGLVTFVAVFAASLRESANAALDETLRADFILNTEQFSGFSPKLAERLADPKELGAVSPVRIGQFKRTGRIDTIQAVDAATIGDVVAIEMVLGDLGDLGRSDLLVFDRTATENGWEVGDRVSLTFAKTGSRELEVAGTYADDRLLGRYVMSLDTYDRVFTGRLDFIVYANAAPGTPVKDARAAVNDVLEDYPNVTVSNQAQFKKQQAGFIDSLLNLVNALLILAIVIALVGIVNTLGLSIYERIRELGLLRAVGMTRGAVARMVFGESLIVALLGALLGIAIGVGFGWVMQRALVDAGITELGIPVGRLVVYLVLAGLLGLLAGVGPAIRAARIRMLDAIAYE